MRRALELAERGWGRTSPNPMVGAVVVDPDGRPLGEGWHDGPGSEHAEAMALRLAGARAPGATVFTTLEPCNHVGRTPPCTRALIRAGVSRVVVGSIDPNLGAGAPGLTELRASGVEVVAGVCAADEERLNKAFRCQVTTGRPWVILKMAGTLDGKSAARDGSSRWITGEPARSDVQRLRAWADAIGVGAGTVMADDPLLTVRDPAFDRATSPARVVIDAAGRVPPDRAVFGPPFPTLVATTELAPRERREAWAARGAEVLLVDRGSDGLVALPALVDELGKRGIQGLLIEGGPTLAWSAIRDDVVNEVVFYLAPRLVGGATAPTLLDGVGIAPLADAVALRDLEFARIGDDLKVVARVHRHR
jgi:diaminohydroxyphosphoribosylaminopyrimidine deaminase/5-amino-6-(5-phosphoribosylamino)uracil reductase